MSNTTVKQTTSTATLKAASKTEKPKRAHDRWEEYESFVSEYKAAKNIWPTISEAVAALQKKRPLAKEADWVYVAKHYNSVQTKEEKEPRVTSEVSDGGLQLALQTMATGRAHSLYRHHPKEVEAYAKRTGKVVLTSRRKPNRRRAKRVASRPPFPHLGSDNDFGCEVSRILATRREFSYS